MCSKSRKEAKDFLYNEKQFHLGMLPTEQSNPKTRDLDRVFAANPGDYFGTMGKFEKMDLAGKEKLSPVQYTIKQVTNKHDSQ